MAKIIILSGNRVRFSSIIFRCRMNVDLVFHLAEFNAKFSTWAEWRHLLLYVFERKWNQPSVFLIDHQTIRLLVSKINKHMVYVVDRFCFIRESTIKFEPCPGSFEVVFLRECNKKRLHLHISRTNVWEKYFKSLKKFITFQWILFLTLSLQDQALLRDTCKAKVFFLCGEGAVEGSRGRVRVWLKKEMQPRRNVKQRQFMTNGLLFLQLWFHVPRVVYFALHFVGMYRPDEGLSTHTNLWA